MCIGLSGEVGQFIKCLLCKCRHLSFQVSNISVEIPVLLPVTLMAILGNGDRRITHAGDSKVSSLGKVQV